MVIAILFGLSAALALVSTATAVHLRLVTERQSREIESVRRTAVTDSLTGLLNRRGFIEAAERELDRARRYNRPLAVAFVDVRGLKGVNDSEGHRAGDQVLKDVAGLLRESSRSHDLVGRIGGDELALLLAEQSASGVAAVGRRVKSAVPVRRDALGLDTNWDLTVGIAIYPSDGETLDELMATADWRLYMQRGIRLRNSSPLATGQRTLEPVDHRHRRGIDAPEYSQVERN
jgi:diguanylate cyclase (GGDEF)-like protein